MDSELVKWKTIHFQVNNKADLPSLETLQGEIEQYFPKDFTINHSIDNYSYGYRKLVILGEKPYDSFGNKSYLLCNVWQNDKKAVNSYSIEIFYNIEENMHGELRATESNTKWAIIKKWAIKLFLCFSVGVVAAFFIGGSTVLALAFLLFLGLGEVYLEKKKEDNYLLECCEKMLQSIKELERELNMKQNDQKYSYGDSSINNDRISALKEKLTSGNGGKGYRIAEDGTIIRN